MHRPRYITACSMALQDLDKSLGRGRLHQAAVTGPDASSAVQGLQVDERLHDGMQLPTPILLCTGFKRIPVQHTNMQLPSSPGERGMSAA